MQKNFTGIIIVTASVLLFVYVAVRAAMLGFTVDEAFSYNNYVVSGDLFPNSYNFMTANHHLLNIWGMWFCEKLFGSSEFSLRIPALIGHVLFLYFTARFSMRHSKPLICIGSFLLLNLHPYLLDFFSLARGYGLSWGLLSGGLYHAFLYLLNGENQRRHLLWATIFFSLALLASYVLLFVVAAAMFFLGCRILFQRLTLSEKSIRFAILTLPFAIGVLIALPVMMKLKEAGALHWGSYSMEQMTGSLLSSLLYDSVVFGKNAATNGLVYVYVFLGLLTASVMIITIIRKFDAFSMRMLFVLFLFLVSCVAVYIQHEYEKMLCPKQRTAFYLVLLILFLLVLTIQNLPERKTWPGILASVIVLPLAIHFFSRINFTHCLDWKFCEGVSESVRWIKENHPPFDNNLPGISAATDNELYQTVLFYRTRYGLENMSVQMRPDNQFYPDCDYYIAETANRNWIPQGAKAAFASASGEMVVHSDPSLFQKPLLLGSVREFADKKFPLDSVFYSSPGMKISLPDSLPASSRLRMTYQCEIDIPDPSLDFYLSFSMRNDTTERFSCPLFAPSRLKTGVSKISGSVLLPRKDYKGCRAVLSGILLHGSTKPARLGPVEFSLMQYKQ